MNFLLDTHIALWAILDHANLSAEARKIIEAQNTTIFVSAASIWEIAIKFSLGKQGMPISSSQAAEYFREAGFHILPVQPEHAIAVEGLPNHHHDPFDRILIAQALTEPMFLLTHDRILGSYSSEQILLV